MKERGERKQAESRRNPYNCGIVSGIFSKGKNCSHCSNGVERNPAWQNGSNEYKGA